MGGLIGEFSFAQTSVCGRFGRALIMPLYGELNSRPYVNRLPPGDVDVLSGRVASIRGCVQGIIAIRAPFPESCIYTDAAKSTRALAAVIFEATEFRPQAALLLPFLRCLLRNGPQFSTRRHTFMV